MATIKIACWNIYFSDRLVHTYQGKLRIKPAEAARAKKVAGIITSMDPDILGIVECMPSNKLRFFRDRFLDGYRYRIEGNKPYLNLGLLYRSAKFSATKVAFDEGGWKARIGDDARTKTYHFSRVPLIVRLTEKASGASFVVAVIHPKSKKTYTEDEKEPLDNRKKIVAQCIRTREIMAKIASKGADYERFIVMGDVNDGPGFDQHEAKILKSGIETLAGDVFRPHEIYLSFVDLSGGGTPTTKFTGAPQLDHLLFPEAVEGAGGLRFNAGSGKIRHDLGNFGSKSGKKYDSDHMPIEAKFTV